MLTISVLDEITNIQNDRSEITGISEINNISEEAKESKEYINKRIKAILKGDQQQPQQQNQTSHDHEGIQSTHLANRWKKSFLNFFFNWGLIGVHVAGVLVLRSISYRLISNTEIFFGKRK